MSMKRGKPLESCRINEALEVSRTLERLRVEIAARDIAQELKRNLIDTPHPKRK